MFLPRANEHFLFRFVYEIFCPFSNKHFYFYRHGMKELYTFCSYIRYCWRFFPSVRVRFFLLKTEKKNQFQKSCLYVVQHTFPELFFYTLLFRQFPLFCVFLTGCLQFYFIKIVYYVIVRCGGNHSFHEGSILW